MPTITSIPVQTSTNAEYRQAGGTNFGELNPFFFKVGSNLYELLAAVQTAAKRIGMFKRAASNSGGSWTDQPNGLDAANSPDIGTQSGRLQVFDDTANSGKIAVLYLLTDLTSLKIVEFDTATDTWGAPTAAITVPNVSNKFGFTRRSNGTYVVIGTNTGHLYYILNTGGAWGAITNTSLNATASVLAGGLIDALDNSYVLLNESGTAMSIRHLDSTNTLSSGVTITTDRASNSHRPGFCFFGAGIAAGWVPASGGSHGDVIVSIAPVATAPVFTDYDVYSSHGPFLNETHSYVTPVLGSNGTTLNVFFVAVDNDVPLDQMMQSVFDGVGTWSVPTIFYDEITNPPPNGLTPPGNVSQFIHTLNPIQLTAGWVTPTAMETSTLGVQLCTGFFLEQVVAPVVTTLQLTKTVSPGGSKVATDWTLSATGPDTISGAGGVGPSNVTPGTYVLSETVVSGYQARNWVCTGGTQNGNNITIAAGDVVVCSIINDPIPVPPLPASSGGRGFIKVTLNAFNACLGREYLLYQDIDRELLKCGVKPACFCTDERDWGGNFDQHEEVPMGPPGSAIAFNPVGQVALPTALAGDTVIFTFRVPWGYDGVILGQYHGYYGVVSSPPVPGNFVEGSGDIIWRLAIASRFGRDCGQMKVSLGSIRNMAPIAGGLQIRSENVIQYIVAAPNTSGALTPGLGNIVAGIHGWMWPRK